MTFKMLMRLAPAAVTLAAGGALCMCGSDDGDPSEEKRPVGEADAGPGADTDTDTDTDTAAAAARCAQPADGLGEASLAEAFEDYFELGVALDNSVFDGLEPAAVDVVNRHFNRISPENALKWVNVQPREGMFRFGDADDYVDFGEANDMTIYGHVLLWHSQVPDWVFGGDVGREGLLARLEAHIAAFAEQYGDRIHYWDVVNEAFESNGALKNTPWREIIGDDYIEQAFRIADAYLPGSKLVYNDYSMYVPGRRDAVVEMVTELKEKGVRIDAVGMQMHCNLSRPTVNEVAAALDKYRELGVEVMITEMDVDVLPSWWDIQDAEISDTEAYEAALNPYAECLPEEVDLAAAERWAELFELFVEYSDVITSVTVWGVSDGQSWLNDWPTEGRTNYGLLFDRDFKPKRAVQYLLEQWGSGE